MPDAVIVNAVRTPIGTAFRGSLTETPPEELARIVLAEAVQRSQLDPAAFDDIVLAESNYGGGDLARHAAVEAGLTQVPGQAVNRHCAGSLTAVQVAAGAIHAGMDRVIVAGGVQSSSLNPVQRRRVVGTADDWIEDWASPAHPDTAEAPNRDMTITVGWNTAVEAAISREDMDAWAFRSHRRAVEAIDRGAFDDEIVPVLARQRDGSVKDFATDEHPRRSTSMDKLASLKPIHPEIEGFSITAGNACGANDGAAVLTIASDRLGLPALATVRSWASVGVDPAATGLAAVEAIPKALARAGLSISDVDLFEINEAFAAMCVATVKLLDLDPDRVNVSGSGCSLGHPVAATGARMLVTLVHELRRRGGGVGVAAMCAGGGMGSATVIEVPAG